MNQLTHQNDGISGQNDPASPPNAGRHDSSQPLSSSMDAIQISRRLQKIANSIEGFLFSQLSQITNAIESCQQSTQQSRTADQVLSELDAKQKAWESEKEAEMRRLDLACEKLVEGWRDLENERRKWLVERSTGQSVPSTRESDLQRSLEDEGVEYRDLDSNPSTSEAADLQQLEQLRREMENHSRRS